MSTRPFQNNAVKGLRGTGNWEADQLPGNWREAYQILYPHGDAVLTAITNSMKSEATDNYRFDWFGKGLPKQFGDVTGVYTDSGLSNALAAPLSSGDVVYAKTNALTIRHFIPGKQVVVREKTAPFGKDTNFKCLAAVDAGDDSYATLKLIGTDYGAEYGDFMLIAGNINPQGGLIPGAISYNPVSYHNYTQIFRNSLQMTRTAMKTRLRTPAQYQEAKREALELHMIEMERAWITGIRSLSQGDNGEPETTTDGLVQAIRREVPANIFDFRTDATYAGKDWKDGAEDWIEDCLEILHRYGTGERMFLCGSGVIKSLNRLAKLYGNIQLAPREKAYGIDVTYWITSQGDIPLKTHPLFNQDPSMRNAMIGVIPSRMRYRYIDDTFFKADESDRKNTNNSRDGKYEEFVTEAGFEYDHLEGYGLFTGFGEDNKLTP